MRTVTIARLGRGGRRLVQACAALVAALGAAAVLAQGAAAPAASTATPATPDRLPPELKVATPLTGAPRVRPAAATLDAVRSAGVLRVGIVVIPPWALPGPSGELVGFEVDVARKLAADLGVRLELVRTTLAGYAGDLSAGR